MTEKETTSENKPKEKVKIKVKRSRRRMYESAQNDNKSTVAGRKEEEQKEKVKREKNIEQDLINERKEVDEESRLLKANEIVAYHIQWSIGVSIVPVPLFDMITVLAIQLRMLKKLSDHYGIKCSENRTKILISSLIGSLNSGFIGGKFSVYMTRLLPGVGTFLGLTAISALSGGITYAIGQVFIQHFESGGTFLDFDPKKVKAYFKEQFEDGKKVARGKR